MNKYRRIFLIKTCPIEQVKLIMNSLNSFSNNNCFFHFFFFFITHLTMVPPKYDRDFYGVTPPRELDEQSPIISNHNTTFNNKSLSDVCEIKNRP
jgi:hypothetical protein